MSICSCEEERKGLGLYTGTQCQHDGVDVLELVPHFHAFLLGETWEFLHGRRNCISKPRLLKPLEHKFLSLIIPWHELMFLGLKKKLNFYFLSIKLNNFY